MKSSVKFHAIYGFSKSTILILIMFLMVNHLKSQSNYIVVGKNYSVVKLCLNNYKFIKAKNLTLTTDSTLHFINIANGAHEIVTVKNVKFLSERNGSHALTYGLVGAGIGLFSVLITQALYSGEDFNWAPMYIGFTGGCAAIGTIIGFCIPKWKTLQFEDSRTSYSFRFSPNVSGNYCIVGLTIKF